MTPEPIRRLIEAARAAADAGHPVALVVLTTDGEKADQFADAGAHRVPLIGHLAILGADLAAATDRNPT